MTGCRDARSVLPAAPAAGQSLTTSRTTQDTGDAIVCCDGNDAVLEGTCPHTLPASSEPCPTSGTRVTESLTVRTRSQQSAKKTEPATTAAATSKAAATPTSRQTTKQTTTAVSRETSQESAGFFNESYEQAVVTLLNEERARAGLAPLTLDSSLRSSARVRAKELSCAWGHTRPSGENFFTAIKISYCKAAENIAAGQSTPERVVKCWMDSPGHRSNILNPDFKLIGVGCYYDYSCQFKTYWSQLLVVP